MALYKVVLNGQAQGQDVKNILYYRNGVGVDVGGLTIGGAEEVAQAVKAIVWPAMKPIMPIQYRLQDIEAYVYNDQTFDLLYQNPVSVGVNETGLNNSQLNGPATCMIVRFVLEPHIILVNGPKPPKRGYLAIGPLTDNQILDDGTISQDAGFRVQLNVLTAALANNVFTVLPIPAVFFPVRVHQDVVGIVGKLRITSFADVRDAIVRNQSSWRRSRQPES